MAFTQGVTSSSSRRRERPNIVPSRSVCRNLFGPVDHEQLKADFLREKEEIIKEDTRKWNFDFENDIPLLGRYLWEKMYSDLARERTTSSFSSRASEGKATNERSSCTTVAEHPDVTPSATSLDMAHRTIQISDNVDSEKPESEKCDPKMTPRKLRSRSSTGKITGEGICYFAFREKKNLMWCAFYVTAMDASNFPVDLWPRSTSCVIRVIESSSVGRKIDFAFH